MKEGDVTWSMTPILQSSYENFWRSHSSKSNRKISLGNMEQKSGENFQLSDLSKFHAIQHRWMSIEWLYIASDLIPLGSWNIPDFKPSLLSTWTFCFQNDEKFKIYIFFFEFLKRGDYEINDPTLMNVWWLLPKIWLFKIFPSISLDLGFHKPWSEFF